MPSGDPFKKVFSGQRLTIQAPAWNRLMDLAQAGTGLSESDPASSYKFPGMVLIQNNSGSLVGQFGVLGISGVAIAESANPAEFKSRILLTGDTPTVADHAGKFVVCAEPIADGEIGKAFAFGVFPAYIYILHSGDMWADVKDSDATQLQSGANGGAHILWSESGTGSKWAVVSMSNNIAPVSHRGCFGKPNGTDGGSPDQPTYDVFDFGDTALTTPINQAGPLVPENSPARIFTPALLVFSPSPLGPASGAGGFPVACYFDLDNVIHLWSLHETVCAVAGTPA